jgi:UDP-N-acetylbacillosamine N-acetyltransferase
MNKHKVIVWGASGHAKVVADILRLAGHEIIGFLDDEQPTRKGEVFCEAPIVGSSDALRDLQRQGITHAIIGFGNNAARTRAAKICRERGFSLVQAIHPTAVIARDAEIGSGTVIAAGAVINPAARIGDNVIVNTHATIEHDCIVEEGAHIGPGANLGGAVYLETCAWIGIGASISDHCRIGKNSIVGSGAVVLDNVAASSVVAGVPAKFLRSLDTQENR